MVAVGYGAIHSTYGSKQSCRVLPTNQNLVE